MSNKNIIIITSIVIASIMLIFIFYLMAIKPVITGEYTPKTSECNKAYDCVCMNNTCTCSFKKWFWENKIVCDRDRIKEKQMEKSRK